MRLYANPSTKEREPFYTGEKELRRPRSKLTLLGFSLAESLTEKESFCFLSDCAFITGCEAASSGLPTLFH